MTVHVDEIHSQVAAASPHGSPGPTATGGPGGPGGLGGTGPGGSGSPPGADQDAWRRCEARQRELRCRVAAEGFDD